MAEDDSFLEIDQMELEKEWGRQPKLTKSWNKKLARAKRRLNQAERDFKLIEAQLGKQIRENPEAYGLRKNTNDAVEEARICQELYQDAKTAIIEAEYEVDVIKATCMGVSDKKYALQDLVKLHLSDYYGEPSVGGEYREAVNEMEQREVASRGRIKKKRSEE